VSLIKDSVDEDLVNICLRPASSESDTPKTSSPKYKIDVQTPVGPVSIPVLSSHEQEECKEKLAMAMTSSLSALSNVGSLPSNSSVDTESTLNQVARVAKDIVATQCKSLPRTKVNMVTDFLTVSLLDKTKMKQIKEVADHYVNVALWKDPLSEGLWVVNPPTSHPSLQASRTREVIQKYRFDDQQVQALKTLCFSKQPRLTARSKFNLNSRTKEEIMREIHDNKDFVLAKVLAEARLSHKEMLYTIFATDRDSESPQCPHCATHVQLKNVVYHNKCVVTDWLCKYAFFKYDENLGTLEVQVTAYLNPEQRSVLEKIGMYHSALLKPITIHGDGRYSRMSITNGRATTIADHRTDPRTIIGSGAWLQNRARYLLPGKDANRRLQFKR